MNTTKTNYDLAELHLNTSHTYHIVDDIVKDIEMTYMLTSH